MQSFALRLLTFATLCAAAVSAQPLASSVSVPRLVRFSGSFHPAAGSASAVEGVTLAIYRDPTGGSPLWQEVQNVQVDSEGHYSLLLGSTLNEGLPMDLFASNEPRWLGVQFNRSGEVEQPRMLLASVPYALKSVDAETLGGKPASAYLLAESSTNPSSAPTTGTVATSSATPSAATSTLKPRATSGTPNFVAKFANTTDLTNSAMFETGGFVGVGTANPLISLDVRTGALPQMGIAQTSDYLTFFASDIFGPAIYWDPNKDMRFGKGGSSLYNPFGFIEQMRIQSSTGNVGIGTTVPGSKLDVAGDINFTGLVRYLGNPALQITTVNGLSGGSVSLGAQALQNFSSGTGNTAIGAAALQQNGNGFGNTAVGNLALQNNTGFTNTAVGSQALQQNVLGTDNTALGAGALGTNVSGNSNVAVGFSALQFSNGVHNVAVGQSAGGSVRSGTDNIAIGYEAGLGATSDGSRNIFIGNLGTPTDSGVIRIGNNATSFFASGVRGVTTANPDALPVVIDSAGQLGTVSSSRRFKEDIQDMGDSSRGLMDLRPVTFRYKQPYADGSQPIQYGLIAEEVAEVYPDLVAHSADGQIESVKYQVLDSMLLNEVQRQQAEIASQKELIQKLLDRMSKLESALTAAQSNR